MKSTLILKKIIMTNEEEEETHKLWLVFNVNQKKEYLLNWLIVTDDKEPYLDSIESLVNEATLILNTIPGMKLKIDQSVVEFIEGFEEEVKKFVNQLVIEI